MHGSFIYLEQNAQALARLPAEARPQLGPTFKLQQRVLFGAYLVIAVPALAAVLFTFVAAMRDTLLSRWMAAANPVTMIVAWLLPKRPLPKQLTQYTEGAGINIGFFSLKAYALC